MTEHDIDAVISAPPGGLTGYRDAVAQALEQRPVAERSRLGAGRTD